MDEAAAGEGLDKRLRTRRQILVDKRFQFQYLKIWLWVSLGIIAMSFVFYLVARGYLGVRTTDPIIMRVMAGISVFILIFCSLMGILTMALTHRVAGAAFSLERSIERLSRNELDHRIGLRPGDYLQQLADALNELQDVLKRRQKEALELQQALEQLKGGLSGEPRRVVDGAIEYLKSLGGPSSPPPGGGASA